MDKKWKRRVGVVFATAAAGVLATAGAAQANAALWLNDGSGVANWTEDGDKLTVCDQSADGWGVRGYVYRPNAGDPGNGTVLMKTNSASATSGCSSVTTNISETIAISMKVCHYAGATVTHCVYTKLR